MANVVYSDASGVVWQDLDVTWCKEQIWARLTLIIEVLADQYSSIALPTRYKAKELIDKFSAIVLEFQYKAKELISRFMVRFFG